MKDRMVSMDDLQDVIEISNKIENYSLSVCEEYETNLAISGIVNGTFHALIEVCEDADQLVGAAQVFYNLVKKNLRH